MPQPSFLSSLFSSSAMDSPTALAAALAPWAAPGHFDELRGQRAPDLSLHPGQHDSESGAQSLTASWQGFFNWLGKDGFYELNHRTANLQRQIRDNGVTYNVYADATGPQRPWSLDLFPLLISPADWARIEAGVQQRARLLEGIMADIYGPQTLLSQGLVPSALVHGHPGYLRSMHGVAAPNGRYLQVAAFDLAHRPDGKWAVVSQRTQAPSGLGYLLENRLTVSRLFPEAFRDMKVQSLTASYKALIDSLQPLGAQRQPGEAESRVVLLTPGPYNETYFEHAYLARFLGLTLVQGSDLLVRGERLYLKTLRGLEPVHGLLKRVDDEFLDPLELRSDSTLGVPGLMQVLRAGHLRMLNMPGSGFLESTALLGFLPALSRRLLGENLTLPSLPTWWCGEQAIVPQVLSELAHYVIKPTYPHTDMRSVIGPTLSPQGLQEWAARIRLQGDDYTVQAYVPLSQTPTWQGEKIALRSVLLRVFAIADGQGYWQVLPGGLARLAAKNENMASMQYGGSSADVWVKASQPALEATQPIPLQGLLAIAERGAVVTAAKALVPRMLGQRSPITSRAAENLFWLGRYTERSENLTRLAQLSLQCMSAEDPSPELLHWLTTLALDNTMVPDTVPHVSHGRRVFERALIASLADTDTLASVGFNLRALKNAAAAVRERLSQEQWHVMVRTEADFFNHCSGLFSLRSAWQSEYGAEQGTEYSNDYSSTEAVRALEVVSAALAAMTGAQTDRMTRDDGWRLLSIGRLLERLQWLSRALISAFETSAVEVEDGFDAVLALFDSTITFHAQYQQQRDIPALLDLLVLDHDNPRALAWVVQSLSGRLAKLTRSTPTDLPDLGVPLPDPAGWDIGLLCPPQRRRHSADWHSLTEQLQACSQASADLAATISRRYFSYATTDSQSLGA